MATTTYGLTVPKAQFQANYITFGDQTSPDVLGLSNGGFVVAHNNGDVDGYIILEFYDPNLALIGQYQTAYDDNATTLAQGAPTLIELDNGNVVVVWDDNSATDAGLSASIWTAGGANLRAEYNLTTTTGDMLPQAAALVGNNAGFALINQFSDDIYLEIYNAAGDTVVSEFEITTTDDNNSAPVLAGLTDGGLVAVWVHNNGVTTELRARIFDANGAARSISGSTNDFIVANGANMGAPAIAALQNGNFAIAYTDASADGGQISLKVFNASGGVVHTALRVNYATVTTAEIDPDITVLENGFIVVSWTMPGDGSDEDVYAALFDQAGNSVSVGGSSYFALDISLDHDVKSAISGMLGGSFIAGWQDSASDGASGRITGVVVEVVRTITGDATSETLSGDALRDDISGASGNDTLSGGGGADTLGGGAGADYIDGGTGADIMKGGADNDTFVVDNPGDQTIEASATGGTDTVLTSVTRTLGANLENLTLIGSALEGTGNELANTMVGNSLNNVLKGLAGADYINGASGDDQLSGGSENDVLFGGAGADTINGGKGDDSLNGGAHLNLLTGGEGADKFVFSNPTLPVNVSTITDFAPGVDKIHIDNSVFLAVGADGSLAAAAFWSGAAAHDATDRIIYNPANGALYYDPDGMGGVAQSQFAVLSANPTIGIGDFLIV